MRKALMGDTNAQQLVDAMRPFQALIFHAFCPREVDTVLQILDRFIVAKCV